MKKIVELPISLPIYSTYHTQGIGTATISRNPSIRNWYLNNAVILKCNRKFLYGYTTPEINVLESSFIDSPYLFKIMYPMRHLNGYINFLIRNLIDLGYYVYFSGIDDYYVKGKSWYKKRHFNHNGTICGYNQNNKTYCIYAYDSNWVYRKFWTSQKDFNIGRMAIEKKGVYGELYAIKPRLDKVEFSCEVVNDKIKEYLNSNLERYPFNGEDDVYGIVVHDYIAKYVDKLYDGSIPYSRMDRRVFRLIWEHKKVMLERIVCMEQCLNLTNEISEQYKSVVSEADTMRMLYASYNMKRRDSVLPIIKKKLLNLANKEKELLILLIDKAEKELENETVEVSQK